MRRQAITQKQGQEKAVTLRLREEVMTEVPKCTRAENCFNAAEWLRRMRRAGSPIS